MSAMTDVFERGISKLILSGDMWDPNSDGGTLGTKGLSWNDGDNAVTTSNSRVYIRLYTVDPGDAMSSGAAITGSGYAHKPVIFEKLTTETDGQVTTTDAITWTATGDWSADVNGFSLHLADQASTVADGNAMFHGSFGGAVTVQNGDTVNIAAGALTITFA